MNTINNKRILLASSTLFALFLVLTTFPAYSLAMTCGEGGCNTIYRNTYTPYTDSTENPAPEIVAISPSSSNLGVGVKNVTIVGEGFVPSSVVRINGANRATTFIDGAHLRVQITGNDTYKYFTEGGFFVTVFNKSPGGGYSNAVFFVINNPETGGNATNTEGQGSNFIDTVQDGEENLSTLASNAIFGTSGFLPSGLLQWIFFGILILIIVILVRRVHGAKEYHEAPLKHE
jgi:hypothetical protein